MRQAARVAAPERHRTHAIVIETMQEWATPGGDGERR